MAELTEEDIKNMSPEELANLQKQQCIFCHIISGKVPSRKVYEDDKVVAVLDINPANPGHVLLLTKEHYAVMPQVPDEVMSHLSMVAKQLSQAMLKALQAQGTNFFVANGMVAGQRAPHFFMHIIPRQENDGAGITLPETKMNEEDLKKIVAKLTGKEVPKPVKEEKEEEETDLDEITKMLSGQ